MRAFGDKKGRFPLQISLLVAVAACGNPPPSFKEYTYPINAAEADASQAAGQDSDAESSANDHTAADRGEDAPQQPQAALASWSFEAATLVSESLVLDRVQGQLRQRLTMDNNIVATQLDFNQVNRPVVTEAFRQGSDEAAQSEKFLQAAKPSGLLDVLVVMDSSRSMLEEQQNLSGKLMPLLSYVKDADWQIAVVTTDPSEGCLRGLIRKGERDAERMFANAVRAGISGSGNERGILQAVNGLKGSCNQSGSWLRSNSTVAVLIVSDEDNCSTQGQDCAQDPWASADYLVNYLKTIRKVGVNARTYGLVWHPSMRQSACSSALHSASVYADAIARTGGSWGSICDSDYSQTLRAISFDLSMILQTQFALQFEPLPDTLKVYVNEQLQRGGYRLSGNVLEFLSPPPAGAGVRVDYQFNREPPRQDFQLRSEADAGTLQVYLDGVPSRAFSYDAQARSLRFGNAPRAREIKVVYREAGELKSDFMLGSNARASSIRLFVNGSASHDFSFNPRSGLVHLNKAPADGAQLRFHFEQQLSPKLRYPIHAAAGVRDQVRAYDVSSRRPLEVTVDGSDIVFQSQDYRALRSILVVYPAHTGPGMTIELGREVLETSVKVKGTKSGLCSTSLLSLSGNTLNLANCPFQAQEGITISFNYAAEHKTSFDLGELDLDAAAYRWRVLVNGVESKAYTITEHQLSFAELPLQARIVVELYRAL